MRGTKGKEMQLIFANANSVFRFASVLVPPHTVAHAPFAIFPAEFLQFGFDAFLPRFTFQTCKRMLFVMFIFLLLVLHIFAVEPRTSKRVSAGITPDKVSVAFRTS